MVAVRHVLKDGREVDRIDGMVVRFCDDNKTLYRLMEEISRKGEKE